MDNYDSSKPKKALGTLIMLAALGALGFAAYVYLVPFLLALVWNTAEIVVGGIVATFLILTVMNPKFWRSMGYAAESINDFILNIFIDNNPWMILQHKIDQAQKDREKIRTSGVNLKGQQDSLAKGLQERNEIMQQKATEMQIAKRKLQNNPGDEETSDSLEIATGEFTDAQVYIKGTEPLYKDICKLVTFTDKAYKKAGVMLTTAQHTLDTNRAMYEAVTSGSKAMNSARKAFAGNPGLNADATKALKVVTDDISQKIGNIQSSIQIVGQVMNSSDLSDAARVQNAASLADQFDSNPDFKYSDTITDSRIGALPTSATSNKNQYLDLLTKK